MRKILTLLVLSVILTSGICQSHTRLETVKHRYQAGDSIYKYQVEYKDPGGKGRKLKWNFSNVKILDDHYLIKYFHPDKKDTARICGMEHRTRYYYRQQRDSVWAVGFENYTTLMNYSTPELKMKFPFAYGDTLFSTFEGKGMYCNLLPLKVKGRTRVEADAEGELTLPGNIKLPNALRTHTTRYYTEIGKDSTEMTLDTYTWYAADLRHPLFESIKTTIHQQSKDTAVFFTSFYYTPEELNNRTDLLNPTNTDIYGNAVSEAEKVFTEARMLPNPVVSNLIIDYKLTRRAQVWFSVHNNIGIPMARTTPQTLNEGYHQNTIPMGHLPIGTYTVYVHVDDMVINRVVVKK